MQEFKVTDENCFYGFRTEGFGGPDYPCAIVEGDGGYSVCVIHEFRNFYPVHAAFSQFDEAVSFARERFNVQRFQRIPLDDMALTPPGFLESFYHDQEFVNAMRGIDL